MSSDNGRAETNGHHPAGSSSNGTGVHQVGGEVEDLPDPERGFVLSLEVHVHGFGRRRDQTKLVKAVHRALLHQVDDNVTVALNAS